VIEVNLTAEESDLMTESSDHVKELVGVVQAQFPELA